MQVYIKNTISALTSVTMLILFDQLTKWAITQRLFLQLDVPIPFIEWLTSTHARNSFEFIEVTSFFNLVMVWNYGISFGILNDNAPDNALILSLLSLCITAIFISWLIKSKHALQTAALILIISGALGNVIDRLRFGAVIDFLDIHVLGFHWPAFNIADSLICIGVSLLLYYTLKIDTPPAQPNKEHE